MTDPTSPDVAADSEAPAGNRPVLFWRPDSDETHVQPSLEQAAAYLDVPVAAVVAAIDKGDLLDGWFVDWEGGGSGA
jgi:hypothetical protein